MLTTDHKGAIAETAVAHAAIKLGLDVYRPVQEGGRYDLIIDMDSRLLRVQCKWAVLSRGAVVVRCYSSRRGPVGMIIRTYSHTEVDAVVAYCAATENLYLLEPEMFSGRGVSTCVWTPAKTTSVWGSTGRTISTSPLD